MSWWLGPAALAGLAGLAGLALAGRARRRRDALSAVALAEAQARELERALRVLGWQVPGGTTLLDLERRLARAAGARAGRYARALRSQRYAPRSADPPGAAQRRALRRSLAARGGLRNRLRALAAIPPGGPYRF